MEKIIIMNLGMIKDIWIDIFSSQSDIKSDNIVNIYNMINDIVSSEEKEGRQIKKEEK